MIPLILSLAALLSPADAVTRGTVWVRAGDRGTGTGFVVDVERRLVVTARHVVGDRETVEVFFRAPGFLSHHRDEYLSRRTELRVAGRCVTGTVIAKGTAADVALVKLDALPADVTAIPLAEAAPAMGDACRCVGHRHDGGELWLRTDGVIRQSGGLRAGYDWAGVKLGVGTAALYAQLPIDVGDSGAAVVNARGEAIGLVSALAGRAPATTIVVAADEIRKLLGSVQKTVPKDDVPRVVRATVWVRPEATDGRYAGVLFSWDDGIILTSASAVGREERVNVVFPMFRDGKFLAEEAEYANRAGLHVAGHLQPAAVMHVDRERDLALLKVAFVPASSKPIHLAGWDPKVGEKILAVSHPVGVEMHWLLSAGTVRGAGKVVLHPDRPEKAPAVGCFTLQLPHQGNCAGGPVVNAENELISVLATKEGPRQELAYTVNIDQQRTFMTGAHDLVRPYLVEHYLEMARKYRLISADLAKEPIKAGLAREPHDYRLHMERMLATLTDDAIRTELAQFRHTPKTAAEFVALGRVRRRIGDADKAREAFDAALKLDPKSAAALTGRASLAEMADAEPDLKAAALIDPAHADIYRVRASKLPRTTDDERQAVIDELTRLLEIDPYDAAARTDRAGLWTRRKEFKKAETEFAYLTELSPGDVKVWIWLAEARLSQGKRLPAATALETAFHLDRKQRPRIYAVVRAHAQELLKDDPQDAARVVIWLRLVADRIPMNKDVHTWLVDEKMTDAERVAKALESLGGRQK